MLSMNTTLIRLLLNSKKNWLLISPHIKEHVVSSGVSRVINTIKNYRAAYPTADAVTDQEISDYYHTTRAAANTKEQNDEFKTLVEGAFKRSNTNTVEEVLQYYIRIDTLTRIANTSLGPDAQLGKVSALEEVTKLLKEYDNVRKATFDKTEIFTDPDLSSLIQRVNSPGLEWRLEELNVGAGPARPGDFILVAAAVESGKTTFLADQISYWATQLQDDQEIYWFNNEEHSDKVKLRIYQAALGVQSHVILADVKKAQQDYLNLMGGKDRIRVLKNNSAYNQTKFIERIVEEEKPAVVVFDQLDKVRGLGGKDVAEHQRLGFLYNWARDMAMDHDLVCVAASQVDTSGFNTDWIHMHQLRGSKVDKPGELDLMITLGKRTDDPKYEHVRYLHLPKNKMHGGPRSDEAFRHGYWEVKINAPIARYEGVL